jgi:hypothetical protein
MAPADKLAQRYPLAKRLVEEGRASEQTKRAVDLLLAGKVTREIAEEMGIGRSRANALLIDPEGTDAWRRRHKRRGICRRCGGPTYSGGAVELPTHCRRCDRALRGEKARGQIVRAIQDWANRYGAPPGAMDWNVPFAREKASRDRLNTILNRHNDRSWPVASGVQAVFGSWNAAIKAAGFEPTAPGQRIDPERWRRNLSQSKKGTKSMPSPAEVIDREIEKNEERRKRLGEQIAQIEVENRQLKDAKQAIAQAAAA